MSWVPQACTLPSSERPLRVAEFDDLFASTVRPGTRRGPTLLRLYLAGGPEAAATARNLIARERECCSFFTFDLQPSADASELDVRVPATQVAVLDALEQRAEAARTGSAPTS
jgi:hypothetical protein